jgi:hypothetical protein
MKPVYVDAIGFAAPGIGDWNRAAAVLRGECGPAAEPETVYQPQLLPPNERRRATAAVRLAFRVAEDARSRSAFDFAELPTVFASSDADMGIIHRICSALTEGEQLVSPTDFHNSVHNAASGYWSIGIGSRAAATTVAGYDGSFAIGLLEATIAIASDDEALLLVAFDLPPPPPLYAKRPIETAAGLALVLSRTSSANTIAGLQVALDEATVSTLDDLTLERLRLGNPALRALPLLRLFAWREAGVVQLPYTDDRSLRVEVRPR